MVFSQSNLYRCFLKRCLDIGLSLVGIIVLCPLLLIVLLTLSLKTNMNPFFVQIRPGKKGKLFYLIKLRTMTDKKDEEGNLLPDKERLTSYGRLIRSLSIDEWPQLINVLIGQMSLIGPRPLLPEYLDLYNEYQNRRHEIRPGLTGWAQVNGRNAIGWQERFILDVWYVDNISFLLDIKIMWLTLVKIFKRSGINSLNSATMNPFRGNEQNTM